MTGDEMYQWMRSQGFGASRMCQWCGYSSGRRVFTGGQIMPPNVELGLGVGLVCDFCDIPPSPETEDGLDPISRRLWVEMEALERLSWPRRVHAAEHDAGQQPNCRCSLTYWPLEPPENK